MFSKRRIAFLTRIISFASGVAITVWTLAPRRRKKKEEKKKKREKKRKPFSKKV